MKVFLLTTLLFLYLATTSSLYERMSLKALKASSTAVHWKISPTLLQFACGEFKGVTSTLLTLETGAYLGTELVREADGSYRKLTKKFDWDYVERLIRLGMTLDPYFSQLYILGQGHLPWYGNKVRAQNEILDIAIKARFWDWQPMRSKAFNYYFFLNDYKKAGELLIKAGTRYQAPDFLPILGARLAEKGGNVQSAIILLRSMLLHKDPLDADYPQIRDRLIALQGIAILNEAVGRYHQDLGRFPKDPLELLERKYLKAIPSNPYAMDYCIDHRGRLYFDNPKCQTIP